MSTWMILALATALLLGAWSFLYEPRLLKRKQLKTLGWPGPNLKVAFFSDLHAGAPYINQRYIERLIKTVNGESPDLILIGGDLMIDIILGGKTMPIEDLAQMLGKLRAPLGVYAVLGNHDWWNDGEKIREALVKSGIKVLENSATLLQTEKLERFWLVGIGDASTRHDNAQNAEAEISTVDPRIVLTHDPAAMLRVEHPYTLALAGHLHRGQVNFPGLGAIYIPGKSPRRWAEGWTSLKNGPLYVSYGIGTSLLPMRFNAPPEYVIAELKSDRGGT